MNKQQEKFLEILDKIGSQQNKIEQCRTYYQSLEHDIEGKRNNSANAEEKELLTQEIVNLNREFGEKHNLLYEDLNVFLLEGYDLAQLLGQEVSHNFHVLWHYMTDSKREEVLLSHILRDIEHIKKNLSF